ncbi:MAG TPA: hypothetical protein VM243_12075, partial [Phycisphaerae bacterium]|nr:hypothetical protein [Phycisphaerae bacterium]
MSAETSRSAPRARRNPLRRALPRPAPLEWLFLIVGLFLVIHYSWLLDDAFVYFRYVDNLLYL